MGDTLQFAVNYGTEESPNYFGYRFSDLSFTKVSNSLRIIANGEVDYVTLQNFFKAKSKVDKIVALNDEGVLQEYSILNDVKVSVTGSGKLVGTTYDDIIKFLVNNEVTSFSVLDLREKE